MVESETDKSMRMVIESVRKSDLRPILKLLSDDVTYIDASGIEHDKKGILGFFSRISSLWPDREYHLGNWASKGSTVWLETTHVMTHVHEFHGIPPTNKRMENKVVWILEFEAGKIMQIREYEKKLEYMIRQIQE